MTRTSRRPAATLSVVLVAALLTPLPAVARTERAAAPPGTTTGPAAVLAAAPRPGTGYVAPVPGVDPPEGVVRGFDPPEEEWGAGHRGVDLLSATGAPVVSPGPGTVTFAGQVAGRGVLVVTHPDGLRSSLEPVVPAVAVGDAVVAGTPVGVVEGGGIVGGPGASHCAPEACVHWGVRRGERYLDPLALLDRPVIVLLPTG